MVWPNKNNTISSVLLGLFLVFTQSILLVSASDLRSSSNYSHQWVSQSIYPTLAVGQSNNFQVTVRNTGTQTWQRGSVNLGTSHDRDRISRFTREGNGPSGWLSPNRIMFQESSVAPGETATFSFWMRNDSLSPGTYREYFQLVADGITWMEDYGIYWEIASPTEAQQYRHSWVSQNVYPSLYSGKSYNFQLTVRNTGIATWQRGSVNLGTDKSLDRISVFTREGDGPSGWLSPNRIMFQEPSVAPNGTATFSFWMRNDGLSAGSYREYFRLVADGITWMEDYGIYWDITSRAGTTPAVIYGDTRTGHDAHQAVVNQIISTDPDVVFHVGDLVNDGTSSSDWNTFDSITGTMRANALFYPALGNHENNADLYFSHFELPNNERYYSVDYDGCHYIILDSNFAMSVGSDQYNWLVSDLSEHASAQFTAVLFHHPMYSSGTTDIKGWTSVLEQLFEDNGVDIIYQGHNHYYERLYKDGIYYIVTGGGGAPFSAQGTPSAFSQKFIQSYEFVKAVRNGSTLNLTAIDSSGNEIDSFSIDR